jgi:hypothetical protein
VVNFVILVFVGGGPGAMLREFVMLMVPNPVDGFPLDILVANLLAAFLLGLVTALHRWQVLSDDSQHAARRGHYGRNVDVFELCLWHRSFDAGLDGKRRRRVSLRRGQSAVRLPRDHCRREARRTSPQAGRCRSERRRMSLDPLLLLRMKFFRANFASRIPCRSPGHRPSACRSV